MVAEIAYVIIAIAILLIIQIGVAGAFAEHEAPEVYDIVGSEPGPFICILSGTHGNEPAGTIALKQLNIQLTRGHLRIIPAVNPWGLRHNVRYAPGGLFNDINRNYEPGEPSYKKYASDAVLQLIEGADLVLDFHEGWGYSRATRFSIGSSLTPSTHGVAPSLAAELTEALNTQFALQSYKKFLLRHDKICSTARGTLGCRMQSMRTPYILIETTGQFGAQPLEARIAQVQFITQYAINYMLEKNTFPI